MTRTRVRPDVQPSVQPSNQPSAQRPDYPSPPQTTLVERRQAGKALRGATPRSALAHWAPTPSRPDPVALLQASDHKRLPELVPIRYGRMLESPFAFLRGSATVMASDLAAMPSTGIRAQICGDAHLLNFGAYATPERHLVFGLNDFDETIVGPWEWDVMRLVASFVVAGRDNTYSEADCAEAAATAARSYQQHLAEYARMASMDVWYARIDDSAILAMLPRAMHGPATRRFARTRQRRHLRQLSKLTTTVDGQPRIVNDPPLVTHASDERVGDHLRPLIERYSASLPDDRRALLQQYTLVDFARKVVGVGSVGTRCYILLYIGLDAGDPLFLQIKEADVSALEPYVGRSAYAEHGERVVQGQRLIQAASDIFLGWGHVEDVRYYIRQLADMKGAVNMATMTPAYLITYAQTCGWALARAHARSGDAARICGYIGRGDAFSQAMTRFAVAYADQTERDHALLVAAVKSGRVRAETGV